MITNGSSTQQALELSKTLLFDQFGNYGKFKLLNSYLVLQRLIQTTESAQVRVALLDFVFESKEKLLGFKHGAKIVQKLGRLYPGHGG